jgi:GNAT superfamily N-acetyltransferase
MGSIKYLHYRGHDALKPLAEVSDLRIEYFREYPYLYVGTAEIEREYFEGFAGDPRALLIIAKEGAQTVAVSTAVPLVSQSEILRDAERAFSQAGLRPETFYYHGEIIITPECRGKGIAREIFQQEEQAARSLGFESFCLAAVVRSKDDPRRPKGYVDTDGVWESLGFRRQDVTIDYHWPTMLHDGTVADVPNRMAFWMKAVSDA